MSTHAQFKEILSSNSVCQIFLSVKLNMIYKIKQLEIVSWRKINYSLSISTSLLFIWRLASSTIMS